MDFFKTLEDDAIILIWRKFDAFLIEEFKKENADLSDDEVKSVVKDGALTIKWQEESTIDQSEEQEYLVLNFGTEQDIESFNKWKEVQ
jgi:hypothetical protein